MWGWILLLFGTLFFLFHWIGNRRVGFLLLAAFLVRVAAAVVHHYFITLPAGCCDAVTFETVAWEWSQISGTSLVPFFEPTQSFVISSLGATVYSVFGRDPFLLQIINVIFGTLTVYIVYIIAKEIMEPRTALVTGWLIALHPTLIETSAVFLREVQVVLFLALSILYFIKWFKIHRYYYLILSVAAIILSAIFHGAMIVGLPVMAFAIAAVLIRRWLQLTYNPLLKKGTLATLYLFLAGLTLLVTMELPKLSSIGDLGELMDTDRAAVKAGYAAEVRATGDAAYLTNLKAGSPLDIIWQTPVRSVYFLYSPFPWDIRSLSHLKGFIDSGFLLYFTYLIWRYRQELWANEIFRYLLLILLLYIVVFSFGTSNFGTAIRHKAKFLPIIVLFYGLKKEQG